MMMEGSPVEKTVTTGNAVVMSDFAAVAEDVTFEGVV